MTRLGPRDVDAVLGVAAEAVAGGGREPFELPLVERLRDLVGAERAGYYEFRTGRPGNLHEADTWAGGDGFDWNAEENQPAIWSWPLADVFGWVPATAVRLSDFLDRRELRRSLWYQHVMRPLEREHEIKLWLPAPRGLVRGFFATRGRGARDFGERDRAVLTVLQPHLATARERWERRRRPAGLTERESEILALVRDGLTNREIAARLVVSPGTVRTHLEHVFAKLGVHTRTAAVARAFGA